MPGQHRVVDGETREERSRLQEEAGHQDECGGLDDESGVGREEAVQRQAPPLVVGGTLVERQGRRFVRRLRGQEAVRFVGQLTGDATEGQTRLGAATAEHAAATSATPAAATPGHQASTALCARISL